VNFFTGLRSPKGGTPAKLFQISTRRSAGQVAASFMQFLLARESRLAVRDLLPGEVGGDRVVGVDGKRRHGVVPFYRVMPAS
jgi:hypothetical protein